MPTVNLTIREAFGLYEDHIGDVCAFNRDVSINLKGHIAAAIECLRTNLEDVLTLINCSAVSDVVLCVDRSSEVVMEVGQPPPPPYEEWENEFSVINSLRVNVEKNPPSPAGLHMGIVSYPGTGRSADVGPYSAKTDAALSGDKAYVATGAKNWQVHAPIGGLDYARRPIDRGILQAVGEFTINGRVGIQKTLIVIITGPSAYYLNPADPNATDPIIEADAARASGIEVWVISVGTDYITSELEGIAGNPDRVIYCGQYTELFHMIDFTIKKTCPRVEITCLPEEIIIGECPEGPIKANCE